MKRPTKDIEYVELYAEKMKKDNSLFEQQKKLIESQIKANHSLFKEMFLDDDFKNKARKYLKKLGLIKPLIR